jgi:hypothetical protein
MRRSYLVIGFLVLLSGCVGPQSGEDLAAEEIESIEVFFGNLPDNSPDVGPFQAAPEDFDRLLGLLRGGTRDDQPLPWQGLAHFQIRTRAGKEVNASLYQTRGESSAYKVGRTYYRGGTDETFIRTLRACHARALAQSNP